MNKHEIFNNCKARIKNQLRIHWKLLRKKDDYREAFDFIENCMNMVIKKDEEKK